MSKNRNKILVIVEGERTDVRLMKRLLDIYGLSDRHEIVSYNTDIYTLYKEMFEDEDPNSMDILQVLRGREKDNEKKSLFDPLYSDILLIFDLDPQSHSFDEDKVRRMQAFFHESSDMGKLYINYPMVESFYHMTAIPDPDYYKRSATMSELSEGLYKMRVNRENRNHDYSKFAVTKDECDILISQNLFKGSLISGESRSDRPDDIKILEKQLELIKDKSEVWVLCTCCYYIFDFNPRFLSTHPSEFAN